MLFKKLFCVSVIISLSLVFSVNTFAQQTEQTFRINGINPGIEYELPVSQNTTFSTNIGIGYSGSYPNLTTTTYGSGANYVIAPFADLQIKQFYNLQKRFENNHVTSSNSGNFISLRFRSRATSIDDNIARKADYDFAVGPTWGIQRKYGQFHLLFDLGPQFYFDSNGNTGFWPLMPQINIGINL